MKAKSVKEANFHLRYRAKWHRIMLPSKDAGCLMPDKRSDESFKNEVTMVNTNFVFISIHRIAMVYRFL